jgi:O-antigen/teichoic acid export membrane protein
MFSMLIFLGIALYRDIFAYIVGRDFREGIEILPVVLGANVLSGIWLNLSFWYKREEKTSYALWVTLTGLFSSLLFGFLLIPRYGYYGAAWSRFIAEVAMVTASIVMNRLKYPIPYPWRRITEYVAVALALYFGAEWLSVKAEWLQYTLATVVIVIYVLYVVWREKIDVKGLVKHILRRGGQR